MKNISYIAIGILVLVGILFALNMKNDEENPKANDNTATTMEQKTEMQTEEVKNEPQMITREELAKHNNINDCWVVYKGKVYDVTNFLPKHEGGAEEITEYCGSLDFENSFKKQHKDSTDKKIMKFTGEGLIVEVGALQE